MEVDREGLDGSLDNSLIIPLSQPPPDLPVSEQPPASVRSSSSYTLASNQSLFSRDVDHWIRGGSTEISGDQGSRDLSISAPVRQHSPLDTNDIQGTGIWYILALILPLFSFSNSNHWRCSPSNILNTAEFFVTQVGRVCSQFRCHIRRLTTNQVSRELFAAAMDAVLIVYAIGFLILSMYQASIIG